MRWLLVLALALMGSAAAKSFTQCLAPQLQPYSSMIQSASKEFKVPPELVAAIAMAESGGHPYAVRYEAGLAKTYSPATAAQAREGWTRQRLATSYGLMQILGSTAWWLQAHDAPSAIEAPAYNLRLGAKYVEYLHMLYGSWGRVVAAYNGGLPAETDFEMGTPSNMPYIVKVFSEWGRISTCDAPWWRL